MNILLDKRECQERKTNNVSVGKENKSEEGWKSNDLENTGYYQVNLKNVHNAINAWSLFCFYKQMIYRDY